MLIDLIAGARPNFMKIAPIIQAIHEAQKGGKKIYYRLIHTGQHYDNNMSGAFFEQLNIPEPDINLGAGSGTQAEQTAAIMIGYEQLLNTKRSDLCLVVGDVTSTMACAIVAQKAHIKVGHVEAGIRSGDWTMPEEINRLVTDSITNYFFTTTEIANQNLRRAGIQEERIFWVGNTMIDTLLKNRARFVKPDFWDAIDLHEKSYIIMTLHRPANVDEEIKFKLLLREILVAAKSLPIIFPVHPRTAKIIDKVLADMAADTRHLYLVDPLPYLEFNYLVERAKLVITDSGGITEETTVMGIPCMTLRDNTERPETIDIGTNELVGTAPENIAPFVKKLLAGEWKKGGIPEKWDGRTAERIVEALLTLS